jgi:hypothetical protein
VLLRKLTRTQKLWIAAGPLWAGALLLAVTGWDDPLRSLAQGVAVTLSVLAGMSWFLRRERRGWAPGSGAAWARAAVPESSQITIRLPRVNVTRMEQHVPQARGPLADVPPVLVAQMYRLGIRSSETGHRL